jgi:hypothetical protein
MLRSATASVLRDVDRVDQGVREGVGQHDRQAAGAGAQFEHVLDAVRIGHPGAELVRHQLGDEGARHQHALVDVEVVAAQPGFVGDVGGRHALADAALDHVQHLQHFLLQQAGVEEGLELVQRELEGVQDQVGGFVEGFGAAVAEEQLGSVETGDGVAQQVARRAEIGRGHGHDVGLAESVTPRTARAPATLRACGGRCS